MTASGSYSWTHFNKSKRIKGGRVVLREEESQRGGRAWRPPLGGKEYEKKERKVAASPTDKMGKHCYRSQSVNIPAC